MQPGLEDRLLAMRESLARNVEVGRRFFGLGLLSVALLMSMSAIGALFAYSRLQPITAREMSILTAMVNQIAKDHPERKQHVFHALSSRMAVREVQDLPRSRFDDALEFLTDELDDSGHL